MRPANTACCSVLPARAPVQPVPVGMFSINGVEAISCTCAVTIGTDAEPHVHVPVAVDDVVSATTFDRVTAGAAEEDVAIAPDVSFEHAVPGGRCGDDRCRVRDQRWDQGVETGDPVKAVLVEHVAADESAAAGRCRSNVVAEQLVVEVPTRQCLDLVEAVADLDGRLALGEDLAG